MILLDVNVLVYAYRRDAPQHEPWSRWLSARLADGSELGLAEPVLTGFLRIVTNPRIVRDPAPTGQALAFAQALLGGPRTRTVSGDRASWAAFARLVEQDPAVRGNLVPDAWLAALALAHGARLATADRGMRRFAGLEVVGPS